MMWPQQPNGSQNVSIWSPIGFCEPFRTPSGQICNLIAILFKQMSSALPNLSIPFAVKSCQFRKCFMSFFFYFTIYKKITPSIKLNIKYSTMVVINQCLRTLNINQGCRGHRLNIATCLAFYDAL